MNKLSIRTAILLPFLFVIITIVIVFTVMIENSYETLAYEQGEKLMTSVNEVADDNLVTLLREPYLLNSFFSNLIQEEAYYINDDYSNLELLTLSFMKNISKSVPQVSSIGYGDENKNFLGFRRNADETFTLMVKDATTNNALNIYSSENRDSDILASYDGYDPTTRPWYLPVVENNVSQWSDIYINMDEINNATITSLVPIFDKNENLVSVTGIDVSLNGLNDFLKRISTENNGIVYIVDENSKVIAHSTDDLHLTIEETDPPSAEYLLGSKSNVPEISSSAKYFENGGAINKVGLLEISGDNYYAYKSNVDQSLGLDWSIIVVISEKNLIGNMKSLFTDLRVLLTVLSGIGLGLGVVLISFFISSVTHMAKRVHEISTDNIHIIHFEEDKGNFKEIKELKIAYNEMVSKLSQSFSDLIDSQKKNQSLMENSDAYIFSLNQEGLILSFNSLVKEYTSLEEKDIRQSHIYDLFIAPDDKMEWVDYISNGFINKQAYTTTYTNKNSLDQTSIFKVKLLPVINENDEVDHIIATFIDITELIEAQKAVESLMNDKNMELEHLVKERTLALEQAMSELIQKEKLASLGSLVSGISHEVNTPLGVAVSASSYLKSMVIKNKDKLLEGKLTKTEFIDYVGRIEDSVIIIEGNLMRAIDLVQSFKQISVNQSHEETVVFNLKAYLDAIIKSLHHEIKINGHNLSIKCENTVELKGDPGSFSQIITNLIMNAMIHGYDEFVKGQIDISVVDDKEFLTLRISDDGKGMSEEVQKNIFDPFFTTNRNKGGSGLGLNIVYNIVTGQFGGTIEVESNEEGTNFIIVLPKQ